MAKTWDYINEFKDALTDQLVADDKRYGDTWLQRMQEGHEVRCEEHINTYFDQYRNAKIPIPWLKIAGIALIAWVREKHPELWEK